MSGMSAEPALQPSGIEIEGGDGGLVLLCRVVDGCCLEVLCCWVLPDLAVNVKST